MLFTGTFRLSVDISANLMPCGVLGWVARGFSCPWDDSWWFPQSGQQWCDPHHPGADCVCQHFLRYLFCLLALNAGNGWEWGNRTTINSYYGSFPHSLLSTSKSGLDYRICFVEILESLFGSTISCKMFLWAAYKGCVFSWAHVAQLTDDLPLWYSIQYCRCWRARIFQGCPAAGTQTACCMLFF